jgi:hypothetical protein
MVLTDSSQRHVDPPLMVDLLTVARSNGCASSQLLDDGFARRNLEISSGKLYFRVIGILIMKPAFLLASIIFFQTFAIADSWDIYNNPSKFDSNYEYHFQKLPLASSLSPQNIPWSESYWPRNKGSINQRWNSPKKEGFDYISPSRNQVLNMSYAELSRLSPAEKFDLAQGFYHYPLSGYVARVNAKKNAKDFEGICDGWTASAIQFKEPKPVDIVNPDGITIPFGSSDVKALISYVGAFHTNLGPILVGRYCTTFGFGARCDDINPGTLHVILANEIGLKQQAFAADVEIGRETWNQPIFAYEFEVKGSALSSAPNALRIHAKMHYTDELEISEWQPVTGTDKFVSAFHELDYILELDYSGRITGGYWITTGKHPDLFWKPTKPIQFQGDFALLNKIYQPI